MTQKKLNQKLNQVIEDLKPYKAKKIILFGSFAERNQRKDSDIDLFIIKNTKKNRIDRIGDCLDLIYKKEYFGTDRFDIPIEPIVYTPREIKNRLKLGDTFVQNIINNGKVIYER